MGNEVFNDVLQCYLSAIRIMDKRTVEFVIGEQSCTDMGGAMKLATTVLPSVERIITRRVESLDTCYRVGDDGEWTVWGREDK